MPWASVGIERLIVISSCPECLRLNGPPSSKYESLNLSYPLAALGGGVYGHPGKASKLLFQSPSAWVRAEAVPAG